MGCSPSIKRPKPKKTCLILPGTFVKINANEFTGVYSIGKKLGSGAYAEVRLCTHKKTKALRAVKILSKRLLESEEAQKQFIKEVEILKTLDHPNIVRIFEFFEDDNSFYIVMEYCDGGELFDEIVKNVQFNEHQAAHIIRQVFSCIAYLHSIKVVHRDIKSENILLEEKDDLFNIKLIDFGVATTLNPEGITGTIGTPSYIAPEVITGKYTEKCDVWSAGVLMYILLSGCPPFQGSETTKVYEMIKSYTYILDKYGWEKISNDAKDLIKKILVPEKKRISAEKALKHKWITSNLKKDPENDEFVKGALDKLIDFNSENKLKDTIKLFIITQLMSSKELKETKLIFEQLDENGDGKLSKDELVNGYSKFLSHKNAERVVEKIMEEVDTDNNGYIDYNEFLKAAVDMKKIASTENLQVAFNFLDRDGSGTITLEELKSALQIEGEDEAMWEQIIKQVDTNGDGEIDMDEFTAILQKIKIN
jgi:calcium-dependent protein kinase